MSQKNYENEAFAVLNQTLSRPVEGFVVRLSLFRVVCGACEQY